MIRSLASVRAGSQLSLSLLESGALSKNPAHTRHLSKLALELMNEPEVTGRGEMIAKIAQRLADVYSEPAATDVYRDALEARLGQANLACAIGAWPVLTRLVDSGVVWAAELVDRYLPDETDKRRQVVFEHFVGAKSRSFESTFAISYPACRPSTLESASDTRTGTLALNVTVGCPIGSSQ